MIKDTLKNIIQRKISSIFTTDYNIHLQISIIDKRIVITTHKISSRFIEELSFDEQTKKFNTIELQISYNEYFKSYDKNILFGNYKYSIRDKSDKYITKEDFIKKLNISSILDLFDYSKLNGYNIIILIRNPIFKFLSGWAEIINTVLYSYESYSDNDKVIFDKIFLDNGINYDEFKNKSLNELSVNDRNNLLKAFCSIPNKILSIDSHTKEWCTFVEKILFYTNFFSTTNLKLITVEIPDNIKIIDIDVHNELYKEFNVDNQNINSISHLEIIYAFITDTKNEKYIIDLIQKRMNLLDLDYNSYIFLKQLSKRYNKN
jgi:hypothetical protein